MGQLANNSCVACSVELSDAGCTESTEWFNTSAAMARPTGCVGMLCTFCNNSDVGALPAGAYVNVVACPGDTGGDVWLRLTAPRWNTVTLASRASGAVHLQLMGAPSLQVLNDFTVDRSITDLEIHDTVGPCAIVMSTHPATVHSLELALHDTVVAVSTQCGIAVVSTHHVTTGTIPHVKGGVLGVVHTGAESVNSTEPLCLQCGCSVVDGAHFRGVAVANVAGRLTVGGDTPVLLMQSQIAGFEFHGLHVDSILNLSNILGVFGTHYEVEYYNDGELYNVVNAWIWPTIQALAASALGLGGLYISNGNL